MMVKIGKTMQGNITNMRQTVSIERMGYGSEAVGRLADGKAVFVEGAAPGDVAVVEVTEEKPSFARARLVSVEEPSPDRALPACSQASRCGGCPWAHLSYEAQLSAKRDNVVAALARTAGMDAARAEELVAPCAPSKRQWGYRNKLELGVGRGPDGSLELGMRREGTDELVRLDVCPLANRLIERAPKALRGALRYAEGAQDLGIFRVGVRGSLRTRDVEVALWAKPGPFPRAHVAKLASSAMRKAGVVRVLSEPGRARKVKGVEALEGRGWWSEELAGARFSASAPSFFQVNTAQAEKLVAEVVEALGGERGLSGAFVADLYAGAGTFSVPLAAAGAEVAAVESAGTAVRDLRRNAAANGVDVEVVGGDAARELPSFGELDALVVDPPRAGLADGVVDDIAAARPARVAYVSCNPATWARDVARFEARGYRLVRVRPVDLFPQTHHVELVGSFERA